MVAGEGTGSVSVGGAARILAETRESSGGPKRYWLPSGPPIVATPRN